MRAGGRKAQRPGERGVHRAPPHVLRDAGELLLRRLLQEGGDRLGLGVRHPHAGPAGGSAGGDRFPRRRRSGRAVARDRRAQGAHLPPRREGQLLGDGPDRSLRTVQRDPPLPAARRCERPPDRRARASLLRAKRRRGQRLVDGDLEPRLHAVRAQGAGRPARSAAQALDRHGSWSRANRRRGAERRLQLRHRPAAAPHPGGGADQRQAIFPDRRARRARRLGLDARGRRPFARRLVPHRRRRASFQRGTRVRTAPHPAPRDPSCAAAEQRFDALRARLRQGHRHHVGRLSGAGRFARSHPRDGAARDRRVPAHARARQRHPRGGDPPCREGQADFRRGRVQALRHRRVPARPDAGDRGGERLHGGRGRVREADGGATRTRIFHGLGRGGRRGRLQAARGRGG